MLFSSMTFICLFLPLVCGVYFLLRERTVRNVWLLIASVFFYAWGEPRFLIMLLATVLINWGGAILIDRYRNHSKMFLGLTILVDLGMLIYFKYFNFIIGNVNTLFSTDITFLDIILPLGISFYTFQAMSYLIDVYRRNVPVQTNLYKIALYIVLFPQLIAGPIVKYHDIGKQISERYESLDKVVYGIKRFIVGLAKKILLANTMGAVADKIFALPADQFGTGIAWIGAFAYTLQLFYDFSGYSDMAIGLGSVFGFKFLENFNYPYISRSITEFWRRWHISLSTWFKEYLYIPLGGNRLGMRRTYLNLFIVFFVTGIWHGAAWNFVFWGLWHGVFIIIERLTGWYKKTVNLFWRVLQHIYCVLIFVIGWVMFRADTFSYAWKYIKNMFGMLDGTQSIYALGYFIEKMDIYIFIVAILCAGPVFKNMLGKNCKCSHLVNIWLLVLFGLSVMMIATSTYNPFIYFRF